MRDTLHRSRIPYTSSIEDPRVAKSYLRICWPYQQGLPDPALVFQDLLKRLHPSSSYAVSQCAARDDLHMSAHIVLSRHNQEDRERLAKQNTRASIPALRSVHR